MRTTRHLRFVSAASLNPNPNPNLNPNANPDPNPNPNPNPNQVSAASLNLLRMCWMGAMSAVMLQP